MIAQQTAKVSADEKRGIDGWPDGKKLAEFFCAPAVLSEIRKTHKDTDRVMLGPEHGTATAVTYRLVEP